MPFRWIVSIPTKYTFYCYSIPFNSEKEAFTDLIDFLITTREPVEGWRIDIC